MAKTKQKPVADLVGTPETAASAAATGGGQVAVQPPGGHYTDALPCDDRMRRSAAKLLRAGVPLDWLTAQAVAAQLPEAGVREILRHELDRDLSQLYERLVRPV